MCKVKWEIKVKAVHEFTFYKINGAIILSDLLTQIQRLITSVSYILASEVETRIKSLRAQYGRAVKNVKNRPSGIAITRG